MLHAAGNHIAALPASCALACAGGAARPLYSGRCNGGPDNYFRVSGREGTRSKHAEAPGGIGGTHEGSALFELAPPALPPLEEQQRAVDDATRDSSFTPPPPAPAADCLVAWFTATLADGIVIDTRPGPGRTAFHWESMVYPLPDGHVPSEARGGKWRASLRRVCEWSAASGGEAGWRMHYEWKFSSPEGRDGAGWINAGGREHALWLGGPEAGNRIDDQPQTTLQKLIARAFTQQPPFEGPVV